jgi:Fe-S-cluster-containing dehydrogenase component
MNRRKISRRDLLKNAAGATLGVIVVTDTNLLSSAPEVNPDEYDWEKHYFGFICDIDRCIGCGRCVVACKRENKIPWETHYNRTWVERYSITEEGEVVVDSPNAGRDGFQPKYTNNAHGDAKIRKSFFVPKLCNHCAKPPCVQVCPVGATYSTKDGVVLVDQQYCIGCGYCIQACPYGARYMLPHSSPDTHFKQGGVADKCTWCYHRVTKGEYPACVEACPVGARLFGDLNDPDSSVRKILRAKRTYVLKPELGVKPKVNYLGFESGIR